MFIGQYEHSLEEKGRLLIPKAFREDLKGGCIITKGLDGCLYLFGKERWQELVSKLETLPLNKTDARAFSRLLTYGAFSVEIDRVGRILMPASLRDYAQIQSEIVVAGNLNKIEIWSKSKFIEYQSKIESNSTTIAENLENIGI